jgi:hypothetical protein
MVKQMHDLYGEETASIIFYSVRFPQSSGTPPFASQTALIVFSIWFSTRLSDVWLTGLVNELGSGPIKVLAAGEIG